MQLRCLTLRLPLARSHASAAPGIAKPSKPGYASGELQAAADYQVEKLGAASRRNRAVGALYGAAGGMVGARDPAPVLAVLAW